MDEEEKTDVNLNEVPLPAPGTVALRGRRSGPVSEHHCRHPKRSLGVEAKGQAESGEK